MNFATPLAKLVLAALITVAVSLVAADEPLHAAQRQKLATLPITFYPDFVVQGSRLPALINSRARSTDAVVISWRDALKGDFRVNQLGISASQVWLYVPREMDLTQQWQRNVRGMSGIVFVPEGRGDVTSSAVNGLVETASALKSTLVVGIEGQRAISLLGVPTLCRPAAVLTIYDNTRLSLGGRAYREYVDQLVGVAREANPKIKIEVSIATARSEEATRALYDTLIACSDIADRVGIFCQDSSESYESLGLLLNLLRGEAAR